MLLITFLWDLLTCYFEVKKIQSVLTKEGGPFLTIVTLAHQAILSSCTHGTSRGGVGGASRPRQVLAIGVENSAAARAVSLRQEPHHHTVAIHQ